MKLLQILQKCLEDWKNISHLDFCLVNLDNTIYISTCDRALPSEEKLEEFKEDEALCISNMNCRLYKVTESHQLHPDCMGKFRGRFHHRGTGCLPD